MTERPAFACTECGTAVSSLSYRALCPDCGGSLERRLH